ncbi:hypothetical protein [Nonomuraea indica]|uniref:hypothetical protein n=1 Tax=Nonomuraea indica TaxID=1581193 RepID=UPI000C7E2E83|nr:hypothetical protein [Nonomuraea indica]
MTSNEKTSANAACGAKFIDAETYQTITCDRTDRHVVHSDSTAGTKALRVPGGALISKVKR